MYLVEEARLKPLGFSPLRSAEQKPGLSALKLISEDDISLKPILSPDGQKIVYFGCAYSAVDVNYLAIKVIDVATLKIREVCPIVKKYEPQRFLGFCGSYWLLKKTFWLRDSKHIAFSSIHDAAITPFLVNTQSGEARRLYGSAANTSQCVYVIAYYPETNQLFLNIQSVLRPCTVALLKKLDLAAETQKIVAAAEWEHLNPFSSNASAFDELTQFCDENLLEQNVQMESTQAWFWQIKNYAELKKRFSDRLLSCAKDRASTPLNLSFEDDSQRPMVVILHGGPHGVGLGKFQLYK